MTHGALSSQFPTLAQWVSDTRIDISEAPLDYWQNLLDEASTQRMDCLLLERLRSSGRAPPEIMAELKSRASGQAVIAMALDAETRRVLKQLDELGIPAILLKGNALAHWAYANPLHRACSDVDLLVPTREDAERLTDALCRTGCQRASSSGDLVAFELMCRREIAPDWLLEIDIHWRLVNSVLFAQRLSFDELMKDSTAIPSLARNARGLSPVHAVLHAAMHRSRNLTNGIGDRLKWLYDFVVLEKHMSAADWDQLLREAVHRQLAGVTLSALEATNKTLGILTPMHVVEGLKDAASRESLDAGRMADWRYMQTQTMRALPGWKTKARWLWQRLFPSRDYMSYLYGEHGNYASLMWCRIKQAARKLNRRPDAAEGKNA